MQQYYNTVPPLIMPPFPIIPIQPHDLFEQGLLFEQYGEEAMVYVQLLNQLPPPAQIEATRKKNTKNKKSMCYFYIR